MIISNMIIFMKNLDKDTVKSFSDQWINMINLE